MIGETSDAVFSPREQASKRAATGVHRCADLLIFAAIAFRSVAAAIRVFAVRLKVQLDWPPFGFTQGGEHVEPRSDRLVSSDEIS